MEQKAYNTKDSNTVYAALKLIEYLYTKGKIKEHVYRNILHEYRGCIDVEEFA